VEGQLSTQAGIWEGEWEFHAHGHTWCTSTLLAYLFTLYRVLFYGNEAVFADTHTHGDLHVRLANATHHIYRVPQATLVARTR